MAIADDAANNHGSELAYNLDSCVSGWCRAAMGLPPITAEAMSNVASFNRCLLILLDNLDDAETSVSIQKGSPLLHASGPPPAHSTADSEESKTRIAIRQATVTWLTTALWRGQVGRIVAPLFATLLHPSTARTSLLSIRHRRRLLRRAQLRKERRDRRLRMQLAKASPGEFTSFNSRIRLTEFCLMIA